MTWLSNIPLTKKISLLTGLGLVVGILIISFLGIRAVNRTIEVMLKERLNTAHLVANHADRILELALSELENTAKVVEIDEVNTNFEPHIEALQEVYKRLSVYIHDIFLVDMEGRILWSNASTPPLVKGVLLHPDIRQIMTADRPSISGLVQIPGTETLVVLFVSSTKEELQESKAPTSAFYLPGGILSWLLLVVVTVMLIWFTYFRVMYQLFRIPIVSEIRDTNTRVIPLAGLAIVVVLDIVLVLMLVTGPYSHFHLSR